MCQSRQKIVISVIAIALTVTAFAGKAHSQSMYLLPKASLFYPVKGGSVSWGFGGGLGYIATPKVSVETTYLRVIGTGKELTNNVLEVDTILSTTLSSLMFFLQLGSGFYKISDPKAASGIKGMIDTGVGIGLTSIPSLNLRIAGIYYSLFAHKDLIGGQLSIVMSF